MFFATSGKKSFPAVWCVEDLEKFLVEGRGKSHSTPDLELIRL